MSSETTQNWYVLHGDQKHGPYEYTKIIEMLQTNQLMDYNYVWAPHLSKWTQIYSLNEFSKDRFMLILNSQSDEQKAFVQRRNPRVQTELNVLGHNNIRFFDGQIVSLSEAGGLCMINSPLVQVGDKISLHVQPNSPDEKPFNLEGVIIRKNFSLDRLNSKSGLYYSVKFVDVQPIGVEQIRHWVKNNPAEVSAS